MVDELLDIVNEQDEVVGQKFRSEVYRYRLSSFRVVNAFVQNSKGQLWIPRRSASKRIFPLCLDASMGGHVSTGESYQDAFRRELMEELRIDVEATSYQELGALTPHQHGVSAFMRVFLIHSDLAPNYNTNDFIEYYWLSPKEILSVLEDGEKSKNDLPRMIRHLFLHTIA